ncbi:hypothetical protein [Bradyrhizobium liaoningense]|uniref:hypothetical protein n=1 Tax=Bradyrhizobium liaoningense TaxID=43992 RepID=UPI001BA582AC|nr:hypothetical protein [Bradyrhizobium liaoningense]MBR0710147.1 hypothetical protein [Bradyrhizobium liaoningense]
MNLAPKIRLALAAPALIIASATTVAYAQATATERRTAQSDLLPFKRKFAPANRVELARKIEAHCREVLDTVPTNTPAEHAWVVAEATTSDTNRLNRLLSSKEFARSRLKDTFSECLEKVALLKQAQAQQMRSAEAAQFISLAYTFNQDADLAAFAKRVDLNSDLSLTSIFRQTLMIAAMRTLDGRDDK